jgi:hypothetical protein
MLSRSSLVLSGILAALFVAPPAALQNPVMKRQLLAGCAIYMCPTSDRQAQVYWSKNDAEFGATFEIWVTEDDRLYAAATDGSNEVVLKKGVANWVRFTYDTTVTPAVMKMVIINNPASAAQPTPYATPFTGSFDKYGPFVEPEMIELRSGTSNAAIERARITVGNFGLTYAFQLRGQAATSLVPP